MSPANRHSEETMQDISSASGVSKEIASGSLKPRSRRPKLPSPSSPTKDGDEQEDIERCVYCLMRGAQGQILYCPLHGNKRRNQRLPVAAELQYLSATTSSSTSGSSELWKEEMRVRYRQSQPAQAQVADHGRKLLLDRMAQRRSTTGAVTAQRIEKAKKRERRQRRKTRDPVRAIADVKSDKPICETSSRRRHTFTAGMPPPPIARTSSVATFLALVRSNVSAEVGSKDGESSMSSQQQRRARRSSKLLVESRRLTQLSSAIKSVVRSSRPNEELNVQSHTHNPT